MAAICDWPSVAPPGTGGGRPAEPWLSRPWPAAPPAAADAALPDRRVLAAAATPLLSSAEAAALTSPPRGRWGGGACVSAVTVGAGCTPVRSTGSSRMLQGRQVHAHLPCVVQYHGDSHICVFAGVGRAMRL